MKYLHFICTLLFGVAVLLFFGLAYPHHLHYQEQYQLFLFDTTYVWEIVRLPGGIADLLGRFYTQFFLYAWVGASIIALLLSAVQLLTLWLITPPQRGAGGGFYVLTFVPSFLLWLYLLDENALLSGVWAVLLTLLVACVIIQLTSGWIRYILLIVAIPILYMMAGPVCLPIPLDSLWLSVHYHRYPTVFPWLLWAAALSVYVLVIAVRLVTAKRSPLNNRRSVIDKVASLVEERPAEKSEKKTPTLKGLPSFIFCILVLALGATLVWKNANFKAEKVMQYDFMARHQQWNRILQTINAEKPNNQIGVTVQNLALAMHGMLLEHIFDFNQNGIAGLLPDVKEDATSPLPTAEAFYQLGMINVAQRTVFEAQEAILDFQKSGRCYQRLAQTNLINGQYAVARKYLSALQKTLFYREWANETLPLLGNEEAIARHPEYGRLRQCAYKDDFYFSDHVTPEMLESLYQANTDNRLAYQYLMAYYILTGDREGLTKISMKK
jgi:hypothetical protein